MPWERVSIRLECGCGGAGLMGWDHAEAGDIVVCEKHGETKLLHKSRIMDSKGSRNFQLGLEVEE